MVSIVKVCWGIRLLMLEIELLGTCFWRHGCSPRIYPAFHTACPRFVDICEAGTINMLSGRSFAYKGPYVKAMAFPVIMYGCESWNIKKAEHQRVDAFELWCWRRLLRVPWTARRSNQSILKEINPEYSLEGLMLKLQYFGHLMQRANSLEKNPDAGKDWGQEEKEATEDEMGGWACGHTTLTHPISSDIGSYAGSGLGSTGMGDGWMVSPTQWTWVWTNSGRWWRTGKSAVLHPWSYKESDMT